MIKETNQHMIMALTVLMLRLIVLNGMQRFASKTVYIVASHEVVAVGIPYIRQNAIRLT